MNNKREKSAKQILTFIFAISFLFVFIAGTLQNLSRLTYAADDPVGGTGTSSTAWYDDAIALDAGCAEFTVSTADDLAGLSQLVNGGNSFDGKTISLINNISLSVYTSWTPIGTDSERFKGTFDGGGYKITGLTFDDPGYSYVGLFGCVDGGMIKNLSVDVEITAHWTEIGGIVGMVINEGKISNCNVSGKITTRGSTVGGIAGYVCGFSIVEDCFSTVELKKEINGSSIGGIAGQVYFGNKIKNCGFAGSITIDVNGADNTCSFIGGVAGYVGHISEVKDCYAICDITVTTTGTNTCSEIGGVAGVLETEAFIKNSYYKGNIIAHTSEKAGGIAGFVKGYSLVSGCYSSCNVSAEKNAGGIAGVLGINEYEISWGAVLNCYATGNVSASIGQAGGIAGVMFDSSEIKYCYATGVISSQSAVGGIAGIVEDNDCSVSNSVALNSHVLGVSSFGRIAGFSNGTLLNNYAIDTMQDADGQTDQWEGMVSDGKSGADISLGDAFNASFWATGSNWDDEPWDTDIWSINNGGFPKLKNIEYKYRIEFNVINGNGLLTAKVGGEEISPGDLIEEGETITFTASPNANYKVKEWKLDGNIVNGTNPTYSFTVVQDRTVTVEFEAVITNAQTPTITIQPQGPAKPISIGTDFQLEITASVTDGGTLTYQWYRSGSNGFDSGTLIAGATGRSYKPDTSDVSDYWYYCVVTNTNNSVNGEKAASEHSTSVQVQVQVRDESNPDSFPWEIVVLVVVVVLLGGGFAAYWFIFRKKKI